jgi:hypothetical protein
MSVKTHLSTYVPEEVAEQVRLVARGHNRSVANYIADVLAATAEADAALLKRREVAADA